MRGQEVRQFLKRLNGTPDAVEALERARKEVRTQLASDTEDNGLTFEQVEAKYHIHHDNGDSEHGYLTAWLPRRHGDEEKRRPRPLVHQ
jgi:hypothetical protein